MMQSADESGVNVCVNSQYQGAVSIRHSSHLVISNRERDQSERLIGKAKESEPDGAPESHEELNR